MPTLHAPAREAVQSLPIPIASDPAAVNYAGMAVLIDRIRELAPGLEGLEPERASKTYSDTLWRLKRELTEHIQRASEQAEALLRERAGRLRALEDEVVAAGARVKLGEGSDAEIADAKAAFASGSAEDMAEGRVGLAREREWIERAIDQCKERERIRRHDAMAAARRVALVRYEQIYALQLIGEDAMGLQTQNRNALGWIQERQFDLENAFAHLNAPPPGDQLMIARPLARARERAEAAVRPLLKAGGRP